MEDPEGRLEAKNEFTSSVFYGKQMTDACTSILGERIRKMRQWRMNLPINTCYLGSAMNLGALNVPEKHPLYRVLRQFAPSNAADDQWMYNDNLREEALRSWGRRTALGQTGWSLQGEKQEKYVSRQQQRRRVGRDVTVRENGAVALRWIDPDGLQVEITICINLSVVNTLGARRTRVELHFLEDGIGLQDEQQILQAPGLIPTQGVLPRNRFFTQVNSYKLE
ncbi:hypothetical protein BDA99DRAFT_542474 [Phascolomyces articulosus]|uniref:Uncharacterized protein n=1 Tax=Phascolomyces articulosus TaxID=60185 RepID=A0AAD5JPB6_9FUNG|nr:hypothetical protein BDA99DRAFT_542474 [Phascolomyces articulosus]